MDDDNGFAECWWECWNVKPKSKLKFSK